MHAILGWIIFLTQLCAPAGDAAGKLAPSLRGPANEADTSACVWVFFRDKGLTSAAERDAALAKARDRLTPAALHRRQLRRTSPGLVDARDIPVCPIYASAVSAAGATIRIRSPWLNAVSVKVDRARLLRLAALPFVERIEPVRRVRRCEVEPLVPTPVEPRALRDGFYGLAEFQHNVIDVLPLHAEGITGRGIIIGVLDTGFRLTHAAYNDPNHPINVLDTHDFVNDDANVGPEDGDPPDQHVHGTLVLGTIGAYKPQEFVGAAYDASFVLAKTEDVSREVPAEEDYYVAGLQWIEAHGADIATSSLGYIDWYTQSQLDGLTAVTTIAVNAATENGLVCVTAAGNSGLNTDGSGLIAPADAFNVITCSAVNMQGQTAGFASKGPTADGRVKPEVQALGDRPTTVSPSSDTDYVTAAGTSLSTPQVAAVAALLLQAHPHWTIAQLRTALFETADYYVANGTYDPSYIRGYGIIDAYAASQMVLCTCDVNGDRVLDAYDWVRMLDCYGGPEQASDPQIMPSPDACLDAFDLERDGDVDLHDLWMFQFEYSN